MDFQYRKSVGYFWSDLWSDNLRPNSNFHFIRIRIRHINDFFYIFFILVYKWQSYDAYLTLYTYQIMIFNIYTIRPSHQIFPQWPNYCPHGVFLLLLFMLFYSNSIEIHNCDTNIVSYKLSGKKHKQRQILR